MIVVSLTYLTGPEEADRHMEGHVAWLKTGYAAHGFLAAGRKVPRTGGLILARGPREAVEAYLESDPFMVHGVAEYAVTEVDLTSVAEGLDALKG